LLDSLEPDRSEQLTAATVRQQEDQMSQSYRQVTATMATCIAVLAALVFAGAAQAGTTTASTLTKTGTDPTTKSSATATETTGTAGPGDTLNWVLHYTNNTGSNAKVNITDPIGENQTYVSGSLQAPPNLTPQFTTNGSTWSSGTPPAGATGVGATGTVEGGTTLAESPTFGVSTVNFHTVGGDGYTVEGLGGNIYTVFHHTGGTFNPTTAVFCATLAGGGVCEGWPANSTYVNPTAGTPIGTGGPGTYTTAGENGSFISHGNLYWPVENTVPTGGPYTFGLQCLNLSTRQSCGFIQLGTEAISEGSTGMISTDGIAASDGYYYVFDGNGNLDCFNPSTSAACGSTAVTEGVIPGAGATSYLGSILTDGPYVFLSYVDAAKVAYMSCYSVETHALCPGYPKNLGPAKAAFPPFLAPVLSTAGSLTGMCAIGTLQCYTTGGAPIASNPYGTIEQMAFPTQNGFGSGQIYGTKFYSGDAGNPEHVQCFDFAAWSGTGTVPRCAGFSGPLNTSNYTVRALENLPGCMAANGDAGEITIFNALTGAPCSTGTQKVKLTPQNYYCDGQEGHATSWGAVSLAGLTGGEFGGGSVTLYGADGKAVPGWSNVPIPAGSTSLDISSLPVSGNTASLTAEVSLAAVTNPAAVERSKVVLSWRGDGIEVCFKTQVGPQKCSVAQALPNEGNAVTTGANGVSDAPAGDSSGRATFFMASNPELSGCEADLQIEKFAGSAKAVPGGGLMYTLVVQNKGPDAATKAVVSDAIPRGLSITSAQPSQGECKVAGAIDCELGTIVKGGSAQILVTAKVDSGAPGTIKNCTTVSAVQVDPVTTNNASCVETPVVPPPAPPQPFDLEVVKTVNHQHAVVGQPLTYTLTVTNKGPGAAPNAMLNDTSTTPLRVVSAKPSVGQCGKAIPLHCAFGTINAGAAVTIKVVAKPTLTGKKQENTASATGEGTDSDPANNVHAARISAKAVHLRLTKVADRKSVTVGGLVHYTIRVKNPTLGTAHKVETCDTVPNGLAYVRSTPKAKLAKGKLCWKAKALAGHKTLTYKVTARALRAGRTVVNHATTKAAGMKRALHAKAKVHVRAPKPLPTPVTG
jgi:uncharacterized repeat protein (TIGR01451 family)